MRQTRDLILRRPPIRRRQVHVVSEHTADDRHATTKQQEQEERERIHDRVPCKEHNAKHMKLRSPVEIPISRVEDPHVARHEPYRKEKIQERPRLVHQIRAPVTLMLMLSLLDIHRIA